MSRGFTLGPEWSCEGSRQQVRCRSTGRSDIGGLLNAENTPALVVPSPPFLPPSLRLFVSVPLLHSCLYCRDCTALPDAALLSEAATLRAAFVGVSHCDDLMWAAQEHPHCAVCSCRALLPLVCFIIKHSFVCFNSSSQFPPHFPTMTKQNPTHRGTKTQPN